MRIVSGLHRGRVLVAPDTRKTRPTSDKARETLFNMLTHAPWAPDLQEARVLDLFAGSGALGLEALSRGACSVLLVDMAGAARQAIKQNIDTLGVASQARWHRRDATRLGTLPEEFTPPFNLVFLDPPYQKGLVTPCLRGLRRGGWLAPQALAVIETEASETPDLSGWTLHDSRTSGAAKLWFAEVTDPRL